MSSEEVKQLETDLAAIKAIADMTPKMLGLMKLVVAMLVAASLSIASVAFWVYTTTDSLKRAEVSIAKIEERREATLADWSTWRASKDATDIKIVTILDNQQAMFNRFLDQRSKQ